MIASLFENQGPPDSPAVTQPCREPVRQPVFLHPLLSAGNIVRHAVVPDYIMVTIVDSVAGTGIAVPGLPPRLRD